MTSLSPAGNKKIQVHSPEFYMACTLGGIIACAPTHSLMTPLDLVKCRRQVNSALYSSNVQAWKSIIKNEGFLRIFTGFTPTFIGYGLQGAGKYGFYEFFKKKYTDIFTPGNPKGNTGVFLMASASAEFLADIALCPLEAIKVKMQTTIPPKQVQGLYKNLYSGLVPLWCRQIPYTMTKFASFEKIVELIYDKALTKPKAEYTSLQQTGVSFVGGYLAGILCAVVSHPADVMVSLVNSKRTEGESIGAASARIYQQIGFGGLWNGLPIRIVMIGTLTGFQWLIYDSFKVYVGLPTTGH